MRDTRHRHSVVDGLCQCGERYFASTSSRQDEIARGIETALLHGLFPDPILRRTLLRSVGAATLLGTLASVLPIDALTAIAQEKKPLEKTKLNVGFLPITCATPLIYGEQLGAYAKEGLEVSLQKIAGIALIRDKMINGELDVSQQVMPVALTMTAGLGGNTQSIKVLTILNQNGNSLVLANKHKNNRDPEELAWLHVCGAVRAEPPSAAAAQLPRREWPRSREGCHLPHRAADGVRVEPAGRKYRRLLRR